MWKKITEEEIKDYPVGTTVRINGEITTIKMHYDEDDNGFDTTSNTLHYYGNVENLSSIFANSAWGYKRNIVEVLDT